MDKQKEKTCPIATGETSDVHLHMPWFLQCTEYHPVSATFEPLVNGERAFGALYDAIASARSSIDYVCWGFQPSMYFKRGGKEKSLYIGDLLKQKGEEGVKVRILCWYDSLHLAQTQENATPGRNTISLFEKGRQNRNDAQIDYDRQWYYHAEELFSVSSARFATHLDIAKKLSDHHKNIQFATRDFSRLDRAEIAWQLTMNGLDNDRSAMNKFQTAGAMAAFPTHHQKTVLIDYDLPEKAVGFVMGHNTLDAYWDTDDHSAERKDARYGRNGQTPRQDISSKVTGPILEHLNDNFCQAWKKSTDIDLFEERKKSAALLKPAESGGRKVKAQILRTQSQEGVRDIEKLYLNAANNITDYMYVENQYFRWVPLAEAIISNIKRQVAHGRDPDDNPIHLFVVTNSSDEGIGDGTVNTYRMLERLERKEVLPKVSKLEQDEKLDNEVRQARQETYIARQSLAAFEDPRISSFLTHEQFKKLKDERQALLENAEKRQKELEQELSLKKGKAITAGEIEGLKVHICTLVAPDSSPDDWIPVYIHSKLAIIDNTFTTLGSANINIRSMEVDSEMNICHEDPYLSEQLKQHLWHIHTDGKGCQTDAAEAFESWRDLIFENDSRITSKKDGRILAKQGPAVSLVEFFRDSAKRTYKD